MKKGRSRQDVGIVGRSMNYKQMNLLESKIDSSSGIASRSSVVAAVIKQYAGTKMKPERNESSLQRNNGRQFYSNDAT